LGDYIRALRTRPTAAQKQFVQPLATDAKGTNFKMGDWATESMRKTRAKLDALDLL